MAKSIERREAADGTWETVVVDENGGGGDVPYVTGEGSPVDAVTPTAGKPLYIDTTNGAVYLAVGPTDTDWIAYGFVSGNIGEGTGLVFNGADRQLAVLAGERDTATTSVFIGSAFSQWNGHSQGMQFLYGAAEGQETFGLRAGATGQWFVRLLDGNGDTTFPGRTQVSGALVSALTTVPADSDLAASQVALWFDDTNGVAKLMLKGKTADGTVVTGSVALA